MIERLLELMRLKNLTSSQLADAIKVQRSGISHFVSGRNKPSMEFILKILIYFPDVNTDWLLFGKEPVFRNQALSIKNTESQVEEFAQDGILLEDAVIARQPSLLDGLFPEHDNSAEKNIHWDKEFSKDQGVKKPEPRIMGTTNLKKETSGEESSTPDAFKGESTEKIVIFYRNRTFREFFPE